MNGILVALLAVIGVLWIGLLGTFAWMHTSDPLSRRIAEPFAEYITIGLWVFLAAIALMTASRVQMSIGAIAGVLALLAFSLAAAFVTVRLFGDGVAPRWLMIVALAPPP